MRINLYSAGIIGALYVTPKILSYLCSQPSMDSHSRIDNVRRRCLQTKLAIREFVGNKTWFIVTDMIVDNAWISTLGIMYLLNGKPFFAVKTLDKVIPGFIYFCAGSFIIRLGVVKTFPQTGKIFGTSSIT